MTRALSLSLVLGRRGRWGGEGEGGGSGVKDCGTQATVFPVQNCNELLLGENTGPVLLECPGPQETGNFAFIQKCPGFEMLTSHSNSFRHRVSLAS